jgi:hypothetical protein
MVVNDKHGEPVDDLTRNDFALPDHDQQQEIRLFAREQRGETVTAFSSSPAP